MNLSLYIYVTLKIDNTELFQKKKKITVKEEKIDCVKTNTMNEIVRVLHYYM